MPLELWVREAGILEVLLLRAGRAVTKEQLLEKLCAWDSDISLNAIVVYASAAQKTGACRGTSAHLSRPRLLR